MSHSDIRIYIKPDKKDTPAVAPEIFGTPDKSNRPENTNKTNQITARSQITATNQAVTSYQTDTTFQKVLPAQSNDTDTKIIKTEIKTDIKSKTIKPDRHQQILDAAESVIRRSGFEKATMDEIAAEADLAKGTLYLYFKNKHAIYLSLSERGSILLNSMLNAVLSRDQDGLSLIRELGRTYLEFIHKFPLYFTSFGYYESVLIHKTKEHAGLIGRCEKQAEIALKTIVRALQIGMQDGSVKSDFDPEELGRTIWGASKGVIHMAYLREKRAAPSAISDIRPDTDAMILAFIRIIGTGIKNDF